MCGRTHRFTDPLVMEIGGWDKQSCLGVPAPFLTPSPNRRSPSPASGRPTFPSCLVMIGSLV